MRLPLTIIAVAINILIFTTLAAFFDESELQRQSIFHSILLADGSRNDT